MAARTRAQLKAYFENGDKPTQAEFADLIDSFPNLTDDTIGLVSCKTRTYPGSVGTSGEPFSANTLVSEIIITSSAAGTINVGTSGSGTQIAEALDYVNGSIVFVVNHFFSAAGSIYFSGHTSAITVKFISKNVA